MKDGDLTNFYGGKTDNGYKLKINDEHTPTPWKLGRMGAVVSESSEGIEMGGAMGKEAIKYYGGNLIGESISQANAKRIVECVNACEGVPSEILTSLNKNNDPFFECIESELKYNELKDVIENIIQYLDEGKVLTLRKDSIIIEALRNSINK